MKGQSRSQRLLTDLLSLAEESSRQTQLRNFEAALDYKLNWEARLADRERLGTTGPDPLPHPKDIILDPRTGDVQIKGPMTKEEKAEQKQLLEFQEICKERIAALGAMLGNASDKQELKIINDGLKQFRSILQKIARANIWS